MLLECSLACPPVWQPEGRRGLSMLLECSLACPPVAARGQEEIEYAAGMQSGLSTCGSQRAGGD